MFGLRSLLAVSRIMNGTVGAEALGWNVGLRAEDLVYSRRLRVSHNGQRALRSHRLSAVMQRETNHQAGTYRKATAGAAEPCRGALTKCHLDRYGHSSPPLNLLAEVGA